LNRGKIKVLFALTLSILMIFGMTASAFAEIVDYVAKDDSGNVYVYNGDELVDSYIEGGKLWSSFLDGKVSVAVRDDTGKYVDADAIVNAYIEGIDPNDYVADANAEQYAMPEEYVEVTVGEDGELVETPITEPPVKELTVVSVGAIEDINVDFGTAVEAITFPTKVALNLSDETTVEVDATFACDNYDGNVAGEYVFTATYELPEGVTGDKPAATVKVVVAAKPLLAVESVSAINDMTIAANEDVELKFLVNGEEELTKAEFEEKYEGYTVTFKYNRTDSKLKATGEVNSATSFKYAVQVKDAEGTLIPEELGLEDYLEVKVADADTIATIETVALSNERDYLTVGEEDVKFEIVAAKNALGEDLEEDIFKNEEPTKVVSSDIFVAYYAEDKIVARAVGPVTFTLTYGIGDDAIEVELSVEVKEAGVATRVEAEDQKVALGTEKENLEFKVFDQHDLDITDTDKYSIVVKDEEEKETDLSAKGIFTVEILNKKATAEVIGSFTVTVVDVATADYDSYFFEEANKEVVLDVKEGAKVSTKELTLKGVKEGVTVLADNLTIETDETKDGLFLKSSDKDVFTVAYNAGTVTVTLNNDLEKAATAKVQLINKMGSIEITEAELELEVVNTTPQINNLTLAEGVKTLDVVKSEDDTWDVYNPAQLVSSDLKEDETIEDMIAKVEFSSNDGKAIVTIKDIYGGKEFVFDAIEVFKVEKVSVDPAGLTLKVGSEGEITATVSPANATYKDVTWESSDDTVATVENGLVTAVGTGEATITVTTEDGGFTATTAVKVVPADTVAMIDETPYNSLQAAITAASSGKTIKLYDDIETEGLQLNGKNVAFDLNGKTLNTAKLEVVNNSTVVFKDSSDNGEGTLATDGKAGVINAVNSNVTIENGRFVSNHNEGPYGYAYLIQVRNSELTIDGGYFENNDNVGSYNYLIKANSYSTTEKTTITINGGEFVSHRNYGYFVTGDSTANVEVVINGGKFESTGNYSYLVNVKGSVVINGGKFDTTGNFAYLTNVNGSVVVNDFTYTATSNNQVFYMSNEDSTVTVKGGTFSVTGDPLKAGLIYHSKDDGTTFIKGTLLVDPVNPVKVNQLTHSRFWAKGATQSDTKDADGFYTISK